MNSSVSRRRLLASAGVGGSAALVLAACGPSQNRGADGSVTSDGPATEDLLARIEKQGSIRIGMEGTYRPYAFHNESDQLVGFEKDIADQIAERLGVSAEFIEAEWDSLIAGLDVDRYDIVINNVAITDERKQAYAFTTPYARSVGRVAVAEDSDITTLDQLDGKRAAQSATSNWAAQVEELGAEVVPVQGFAEAMDLLLAGRADAHANDVVAFQTYQEEQPDAVFRLLDEELPSDTEVGVILPQGQDALRERLDEIIDELKGDGTLSGIYQEWVGVDLSPQD